MQGCKRQALHRIDFKQDIKGALRRFRCQYGARAFEQRSIRRRKADIPYRLVKTRTCFLYLRDLGFGARRNRFRQRGRQFVERRNDLHVGWNPVDGCGVKDDLPESIASIRWYRGDASAWATSIVRAASGRRTHVREDSRCS